MARALIFFADGLEECEGLIVVDILRRAGVEVDIAAVGDGDRVTSSHGVTILCDVRASEADAASYDAVVLPGGLPGSDNLQASETVRAACLAADEAGRLVCAICAAPGVLASFGLLDGEPASVFPGRERFLEEGGARCNGEQVTVCGNHVTGQALGAAVPFALEVCALLVGREASDAVRDAICWRG